jgi:hypothetical protein
MYAGRKSVGKEEDISLRLLKYINSGLWDINNQKLQNFRNSIYH